jgi:hypothetical protein
MPLSVDYKGFPIGSLRVIFEAIIKWADNQEAVTFLG